MKTPPTRWFEISCRELQALLVVACVMLLALGGLKAWQRVIYSEEFIIWDAPEVLPAPSLIDINSAAAHELRFLPGIGPGLAGRIVEYREENGPFVSIDDLQDVGGIGPETVNRIRIHAVCLPPEKSPDDR